MIVIENLESLSHCPPYVVAALGTFDGIHLGHQEILKRVLSRAQKVGGTSTVFTFISHPWRVVDPVRAPKLITPWELKMEILRVWGIKLLVAIDFTKALAETGAREFVKHLLVDRLCVKDLFVGFDFAFGRGREGNPQTGQGVWVPGRDTAGSDLRWEGSIQHPYPEPVRGRKSEPGRPIPRTALFGHGKGNPWKG